MEYSRPQYTKMTKENYANLPLKIVKHEVIDINHFYQFDFYLKLGISPLIQDQGEEQNKAEMEGLQNFLENPENELEMDHNLKITSNNKEEIFEMMTKICNGLIKEQDNMNSQLKFLYRNNVSKR